ncbi:MAG: colicin D domain-containing protein [Bacteroidia bacterium]
MELSGPAFVGGGNPYRYTGKEFHEDLDLGLYDFGARWYDPAAGRWWGGDALAENYYEHSPFTYVLNNPINLVVGIGWNKSLPLSWIGYVKGSTLDLSNRAHNAIAPQSGALTPSYPIEELLLPMPLYLKYVGKWVYWGGKWVFVQTTRVGGKLFVKLVEKGAVKTSSIILHFPSNQLQSKFKHAIDFGVLGNFNKANAAKFSAAINQHINATSTQVIHGAYRNTSNAVTFYLNPTTGLNVVSTRSGQFITGAKLSPAQINDILTKGFLW